jgi:hypothetical protein
MCDCDGPLRGNASLGEAVMQYLDAHPESMDTASGIAEWWLLRQAVRTEVHRVSEVLDELTGRGLLERIGAGESARYRRMPEGPPRDPARPA